ncbi:hypothetical protein GPA10_11995 [Streptomyces sp. p1417]|uniref:GNAT family N-acetyltransferase n=1 Tax=Streptomyces typhae TaxID=2681492 RepID=A0A6L6WT74_9ACTN|nr:hypothetical protein [Streptomyces typhae]MVO85455.1 hypothetical protein [Streptomyces typhae]
MNLAASGHPTALSLKRAASPAERRQAMDFVRREYLRVYNTEPGEPGTLWYAADGPDVVATVGVDLGTADVPPELHRMYGCDAVEVAPGYAPDRAAQITRWVSTAPFAATAVMHAAADWCLERGRPHLLFEAKPDIVRHLEGLGPHLRPVTDATLRFDQVPLPDFDYYMSDPPPRLYHLHATTLVGHLRPVLEQLAGGAGHG